MGSTGTDNAEVVRKAALTGTSTIARLPNVESEPLLRWLLRIGVLELHSSSVGFLMSGSLIPMATERSYLYRSMIAVAVLTISACGTKEPETYATLTLKRDNSRYHGRVVRRDATGVTMRGDGGDSRTFLYTELAGFTYDSAPGTQTPSPTEPASPSSPAVPSKPSILAPDHAFALPAGTPFPVRTKGFLDSCCIRNGWTAVGIVDADVRGPDGVVIVPAETVVVMNVRDLSNINGTVTLTMEVASVRIGERTFTVASTAGGNQPGIVAAFTGAREGSPESKTQGTAVHLNDQAFMDFRSATAVTFTPSQ